MKKFFLMSLVALMFLAMVSCLGLNYGGGSVEDDTPTQVTEIKQVTTMKPFDAVNINGAFRVIYRHGEEHSVAVDASEQAFKEMTVYVKDGELCIHKTVDKPTARLGNVKVYVTSPELHRIDVSGSGLFAANDTIDLGTNPRVFVDGKSWVLLMSAINQGKTIFSVDGSANIQIGRLKTDGMVAAIDGSGVIEMGELECQTLRVDITGSGEMSCENIQADNVYADISGSGNVNLKGTVKNINKEISGSGKVNISDVSPADTVKQIERMIKAFFKNSNDKKDSQ